MKRILLLFLSLFPLFAGAQATRAFNEFKGKQVSRLYMFDSAGNSYLRGDDGFAYLVRYSDTTRRKLDSLIGAGGSVTNPNFSVATGAAGTSVTISGTYPNLLLTIPRGNTGATGAAGTNGTNAQNPVFATATGAAGSAATATGIYPNILLTIPRGDVGATGANAPPPNFSVATGTAGSSVTITGTYPNQTLTIPRGDVGATGPQGPAGNTWTLYTDTGSHADGPMTQQATTSKLALKAPITSPNFTGGITSPAYNIGSTLVLGQSGGNIYYQTPSGSFIWNNAAGTTQNMALSNAGNLSTVGTISGGGTVSGPDLNASAGTAPSLFFGGSANITRRAAGTFSFGNGTRDDASGTILAGKLGLGTTPSGSYRLDVNGTARVTGNVRFENGVQITTGAASGKVLTSDATGNGTWQDAPTPSPLPTGGNAGDDLKSDGAGGAFWRSDYANVLDFGAIPNDNSTAARTANDGAFSDARNTNKRVYVPAGQWYFTPEVTLGFGREVFGDGQDASRLNDCILSAPHLRDLGASTVELLSGFIVEYCNITSVSVTGTYQVQITGSVCGSVDVMQGSEVAIMGSTITGDGLNVQGKATITNSEVIINASVGTDGRASRVVMLGGKCLYASLQGTSSSRFIGTVFQDGTSIYLDSNTDLQRSACIDEGTFNFTGPDGNLDW